MALTVNSRIKMTEELGNDPLKSNKSEKVSDNTSKTSKTNFWSEEEDMALLKSLQNRKWGDWDGIDADVGSRSFNSIKQRANYYEKMKANDKNSSALRKEIRKLIILVRNKAKGRGRDYIKFYLEAKRGTRKH